MKYLTDKVDLWTMGEGMIASSLGKPKIVAIDDEIHNKSVLMKGIYEVRPHNISSNTVTFYPSAFQNLI